MTPGETGPDDGDQDREGLVAESIRLQAEEHPSLYEKPPETLQEKVLAFMHLRAYETAREHVLDRDVLDLGCNTGYGTIHLLGGGARSITGVDVSPTAIEVARSRPGADQVRFEVVDGLSLPFPDDSFDLVTSFQVIEHVVDTGSYLAELRRVLRPGGMVIFTTPNAAIRLDPGMTPINPFHVREYLAAELATELGAAFPEVEVFGMFALPSLYEVEIERTDSARRGARARLARERAAEAQEAEAKSAPAAESESPKMNQEPAKPRPSRLRRARRRLGKTRLGTAALVLVGRAPSQQRPIVVMAAPKAAPVPPPPPVETSPPPRVVDVDEFDIGDLYYARHDLDRSMDLMAICRIPAA